MEILETEFLLTAFVVVLIPGTGVLYTVSAGLFSGRQASVFAAFGCTIGIVPHLAASILGLAALLHMSALAFQVIKFVGVAYLLYLAWSLWRETGGLFADEDKSTNSCWQVAYRGFLINILNPKLSLFFLAFFPQFVAPNAASPTMAMLWQGAVFMLMTFVVFVAYGLLADFVRSGLLRSANSGLRIQKVFSLAFAGLAARLAVAER